MRATPSRQLKPHDWCLGCHGGGYVTAQNLTALCKRCGGDGKFVDKHPADASVRWCNGCQGTGYA
jgi:DnaJ-class molecular chaperone